MLRGLAKFAFLIVFGASTTIGIGVWHGEAPYLRWRENACSASGGERCRPPICQYVSVVGDHTVILPSSKRCPLILFLPWAEQPATDARPRPETGRAV